MPRKLRELQADLRRADFAEAPGRGSHTGWRHPLLAEKLTLSGGDDDDAQPYQERQVRRILTRLREAQGHQR